MYTLLSLVLPSSGLLYTHYRPYTLSLLRYDTVFSQFTPELSFEASLPNISPTLLSASSYSL
jgi:hypothetical protein